MRTFSDRTRPIEVNNHERPTEDSDRDWSLAWDQRGNCERFAERSFNVVANSRKVTQSTEVAASSHVALVDGHIGEAATRQAVETALSRFQQGRTTMRYDRARTSLDPDLP
jgi:hypothetical protein